MCAEACVVHGGAVCETVRTRSRNQEQPEGGVPVPLSEDEQRIFSDIAQSLNESDPELVRELGSTTLYSYARRNILWATAGFLFGAVLLVLLLSVNVVASFFGVVVMFVAALIIVRNARVVGRAGIEDMAKTLKAGNLRGYLGSSRGETPPESDEAE